jgi:adenylate cyclase
MALGSAEAIARAVEGTGVTIRSRVGIHTGPVVAGVIGRRTMAFDIWGQTVNIASRMESQGIAGRIQVSLATAEWLRAAGYRLTPRGTIEVRGVGEMATFLLEGRTG